MLKVLLYSDGTLNIERRGAALHFEWRTTRGQAAVRATYHAPDRAMTLKAVALFSQRIGRPIPPKD